MWNERGIAAQALGQTPEALLSLPHVCSVRPPCAPLQRPNLRRAFSATWMGRSARQQFFFLHQLSYSNHAARQPASGRFPVFFALELLKKRRCMWRALFRNPLGRFKGAGACFYTHQVQPLKTQRKCIWHSGNLGPGPG